MLQTLTTAWGALAVIASLVAIGAMVGSTLRMRARFFHAIATYDRDAVSRVAAELASDPGNPDTRKRAVDLIYDAARSAQLTAPEIETLRRQIRYRGVDDVLRRALRATA